MLTIRLLGSPQVHTDGQVLHIERRKSRALLYYLAAHNAPLTRERLLSIFWLDTPRPAALQTLRTTLHGLRKALGPALQTVEEQVALAADVWVDARSFEAQLQPMPEATEPLQAALDLYKGDFLADFSLPDSASQEFEDWMVVERERFRRLAVRGLTTLSNLQEAAGDPHAALATLERALAFNPLQEDVQRERIRLTYLAGDRPGAIQRYDDLRRLLDDEMGVPPMAETRALYDAILHDKLQKGTGGWGLRVGKPSPLPATLNTRRPAPTAQPPAPDTLPFIGRTTELQALVNLSAAGKLVVVEGEPGIGKTRLVEEFLARQRYLPLVGRARELEGALPYLPVIGALREALFGPASRLEGEGERAALLAELRQELAPVWWAEAARLLPELGGPSPTGASVRPADEPRLWEGLHQLLAGISRRRPAALFIDDLHWADASTLALLGYLARQPQYPQHTPLLLIATTRPVEPRTPAAALLHAMVRESRLARLPLARLSAVEVQSAARRLSPDQAAPLADWLMRVSEGNPYILSEMVRHALKTGHLKPGGEFDLGAWSEAPELPHTIYSLIQARLASLSDPARRVLDAAVAAGREFEFEAAARAAALSENAALDALDELRAAGLVFPLDSRRFSFDHSLTMEVAYQEVGEPRHRRLHRRVAEALEELHPDRLEEDSALAGTLAFHYAESGDLHRAAPFARQAGQAATRLAAWNDAAHFYELALQGIGSARVAERGPLLRSLGEVYVMAGQFSRASQVYYDLLAMIQAAGSGFARTTHLSANEVRLDLARSLLTQARFAEIIDLAKHVLAGGDPGHSARAELVWGTALSLEGDDLNAAARHLAAAESLVARHLDDEPALLARIKFEQGSVAAQLGDLQAAVGAYRHSLDLVAPLDPESALEQRILSYNNLAYHLHLLGDASAQDWALAGLRLAQEKGVLGLQTYLYSTLGEITMARGDPASLTEAERLFQIGLELSERLAMPERVAGLTANLGRIAVQRGQSSLAIHRLSTALGQADALGTRHLAAQVRIWLAPLLPPTEARERLEEAHAIAEGSGRARLVAEIREVESGKVKIVSSG